jgi:hypothetical protein
MKNLSGVNHEFLPFRGVRPLQNIYIKLAVMSRISDLGGNSVTSQ